jgi:photosystem II stability/assembly factor-like uncharacterized protein
MVIYSITRSSQNSITFKVPALTKSVSKNKTDQPGKFLEFHRGIRTRDGQVAPEYENGYKWAELQAARQTASMLRKKSNGVIEWTERGPNNVPGRTRALFNIPGDPDNNTWLAGAATGGIWRTTDGGTTWSERSADFPAMPISCFGADQSATVIYAGTGEFVSSFYSAIGNGIFKSTDKGITWTQLASTHNHPDFSIITRLIVDPGNANIIVATSAPHKTSTDNTSAIMRSTDGGLTWNKVEEVQGIFEQIISTPDYFSIQYASQNTTGVWKSIDRGATWNLSNAGMDPTGRIELSVSPVNPSKIYAAAEGTLSGKKSDLYYSSNAGTTWSLVDVQFNGSVVDFFEDQGFYDNTILCDPFRDDKVYFGGVSMFKTTIGPVSGVVDNFTLTENGTSSFAFLQAFSNATHSRARLLAGSDHDKIQVEIRFGPGITQKAHRFLVPVNKTNGVEPDDHTYQNYITVPFIVWDITNNRQLMASFRDQNRNGEFDLVPRYLTTNGIDYLLNSREYIYIHNIPYHATLPSTSIAKAGGQEVDLMYSIFPALASGATWDENSLPTSKIIIQYSGIPKVNATTVIVADGRNSFDGKNKSNQVELTKGVHPDHHCLIPIIENTAQQTYKLLLGNDGGVFVSKVSTDPGVTEGDWIFKGLGYNTGQFYGADKKPGSNEYIGGLQDNGTRISAPGEDATAKTNYNFALDGDGFEVLWNSSDKNRLLGSLYHGEIYRSLDAGTTWQKSVQGFTPSNEEFPFVTKLANSKDFPDKVYTVGASGVYVSQDFGGSWTLSPISNKFVIGSAYYADVEVSRANANIVWAGSGMSNSTSPRNLFVSTNGGKTFSETNNYTQAPLGNITKLATHPKESQTAYALFSFANAPKILRTTNLGQSWEDISGFGTGSSSVNGFPDVAVYCLYVRPDAPNIIWAGTEIGIVESQDNGAHWSLLDDFLNVTVWDMKGQDDQVVIATHGRGIWTATIDKPQISIKPPALIASGTSPVGKLALRIQSEEVFDSVRIYVDSKFSYGKKDVTTSPFDVEFNNILPGIKQIKLIGYKENAPHQSVLKAVNHLEILRPKRTYSTYFTSISDLSVEEMVLQNLSTTVLRRSLQTNHDYAVSKDCHVIIRTPIIVSNTFSKMYYRDIAITEPEHDSIIVEATKNGLDWTLLKRGYDASYNDEWHTAFTTSQPGKSEMFVSHEIDIREKFKAADVVLIRLRLLSNQTVTSWGWALDYITIQELPEVPDPDLSETHAVFPNPSYNGIVNVQYMLSEVSDVMLHVYDNHGKNIRKVYYKSKPIGVNTDTLKLNTVYHGVYTIVIESKEGKKMSNVLLAH